MPKDGFTPFYSCIEASHFQPQSHHPPSPRNARPSSLDFIGKSLGHPQDQHHFSIPILIHFLQQLGLNAHQVNLARELVDHDLLGELSKKAQGMTVYTVRSILEQKARRTRLLLSEFYHLQTLFYVSDASSYPYLNKTFFQFDPTGKSVPKSEELQELSAQILH